MRCFIDDSSLGIYGQVSEAAEIGMFSDYCLKWLAGKDARLRRAGVQALGFVAELEAPNFGRRIRSHVSQLASILAGHVVQVRQPEL